eukprot:TRINITY_DN11325_c0_g1_i1.p1 TRINITY_DN11325_c0_g1~~TRINITY_DN11325_c0_g1_i1.p1  ORF type:complete len:338 (-),score=78.37 TRINITY_DN11325_c0_g1_i1:142-1134(-)
MALVDAGGPEVVASSPSRDATAPDIQIQDDTAAVTRTSGNCSSPQGRAGSVSTLSHPLFQRAAERANSCVFESSPKKVQDKHYAAEVAAQIQTVFESQPCSGIADAGAAMTSHAEAAKALIEGAADAIVFESKPQQRLVDAHAGQLPIAPAGGTSVFESQPRQSTADVAAARQGSSLASSAEQLIQAAAANLNAATSTFESVPQPSCAEASSSKVQPANAAQSTSVFENVPVNSQADVIYRTANAAETAREAIENAANSLDATQGCQRKNWKRRHADEARELIENAASSHLQADNRNGFVFQNAPSASLAMARHGEEYVSESEWDTDEEN